mgnify:CR=1 FL=1
MKAIHGVRRRGLAALAGAFAACGLPAQASVYGSLANFDVVNTTGKPAYGFEIEIEDAAFDRPGKISSIFGLDRVFWMSPDPGYVVRFGKPSVEYIAGFGTRITYGGVLGGEATPSAPYVTGGESCWPGANPDWKSTSCDHFGVATYGSPAKTSYHWLVDDGAGGLARAPVAVPPAKIAYTPPPPGQPPAPPVMVLQAPAIGERPQDGAFWVKVVKTSLDDNVELFDLLGGNHPGARPEIAALDAETEIEWQPLQLGKVDEVSKVIDAPKPSVVYKFQFFEYLGRFDDDGYVDPMSGSKPGQENQFPHIDDQGVAFVTIAGQRHDLVFVGQQIAGFNFNEVPPAVPEPGTWALMLAGVGAIAARRRGVARRGG